MIGISLTYVVTMQRECVHQFKFNIFFKFENFVNQCSRFIDIFFNKISAEM